MDQSQEVLIPRVIAVARRSRWSWRRLRARRARAKRVPLTAAVSRDAAAAQRRTSRPLAASAR
jgi:hypothetical protein